MVELQDKFDQKVEHIDKDKYFKQMQSEIFNEMQFKERMPEKYGQQVIRRFVQQDEQIYQMARKYNPLITNHQCLREYVEGNGSDEDVHREGPEPPRAKQGIRPEWFALGAAEEVQFARQVPGNGAEEEKGD